MSVRPGPGARAWRAPPPPAHGISAKRPPLPVARDAVLRHPARHVERRVHVEGGGRHRGGGEPPGNGAAPHEEFRQAAGPAPRHPESQRQGAHQVHDDDAPVERPHPMRPAIQRAAASCISRWRCHASRTGALPGTSAASRGWPKDDHRRGVGRLPRARRSDAGPNPARPFDARGSAKASTTRLPPGPSGTPAARQRLARRSRSARPATRRPGRRR